MAKPRKKKRAPPGPAAASRKSAASRDPKSPKSMVIRVGASEVGPAVTQLVKDVRGVMEPGTASRLKERRSNRLRDYTSMAGPLGVTHLLLFSRAKASGSGSTSAPTPSNSSSSGAPKSTDGKPDPRSTDKSAALRTVGGNTNLRLALHPRGPTLHFAVERYSLCRDVQRAQRHPRDGAREYRTAPLLVMNNFSASDSPDSNVPKHLEQLLVGAFQGLFPAIAPQTTPLSSVRRVLLLNRELQGKDGAEESGFVLSLRHYAITTKKTGLSRGLRKINAAEKLVSGSASRSGRGQVPNLGKLKDVSDYLLDPAASAGAGGFTSGSETELDTDAEVEVLDMAARKVLNSKKMAAKRKREAEEAAAGVAAEDGDGDGQPRRASYRPNVEKRAVKLVELGPRMRLRLTKVEEGLCEGRTMWHEFVTKSAKEEEELEQRWSERRREKEERKKRQRENVERKNKEKHAKGGKEGEGEKEDGMDLGGDEYGEDGWDSEDYEDYQDEMEEEKEVEVEQEDEMEEG